MTLLSLEREIMFQNEILTVQEVATYLRVTRVTVWRWCQEGTIPAFRVGHSWRIYQQDILHLVDPTFASSTLSTDTTHDTEE